MLNDIGQPLLRISGQTKSSLVTRLLHIQEQGRLSEPKLLLVDCVKPSRKRRRDDESETRTLTHSYHVESEKNVVAVPDVVLRRALKFADSKARDRDPWPLWIDKLCIDQADGDEKEIAIQSMDVVYKHSSFSLGLLFVRIHVEEQLQLLRGLIGGWYVKQSNPQREDSYELRVPMKTAHEVQSLLRMITADPWFDRAWIFQEEYLSSVRMRLLIRHSLPPNRHFEMKCFGAIPGELEVDAVEFRRQTTRFCLAYGKVMPTVQAPRNISSNVVLDKAGQYQILCRLDRQMRNNRLRKALSPVIIADVGRRGITQPSDMLAIAANCCEYAARLNTARLNESSESLSLAVLTLFLLNGEILRHDSAVRRNLSYTVSNFLREQSLDIEPPVDDRELTFTKHCRFPYVKLSQNGIETRGIIWRLGAIISTSELHLPESSANTTVEDDEKVPRGVLSRSDARCLWTLLRHLNTQNYTILADALGDYLRTEGAGDAPKEWSSRYLMNLMAQSVAHAIRDGKRLQLGCIYHGDSEKSPYQAIFIRNGFVADRKDCFMFTSWGRTEQRVTNDRFLKRDIAKYVSLQIDHPKVEPSTEKYHIMPKRWTNGWSSFDGCTTREVVVPWPEPFRR